MRTRRSQRTCACVETPNARTGRSCWFPLSIGGKTSSCRAIKPITDATSSSAEVLAASARNGFRANPSGGRDRRRIRRDGRWICPTHRTFENTPERARGRPTDASFRPAVRCSGHIARMRRKMSWIVERCPEQNNQTTSFTAPAASLQRNHSTGGGQRHLTQFFGDRHANRTHPGNKMTTGSCVVFKHSAV